MNWQTIKDIADNGSDGAVAKLYKRLTGKAIDKCIPCQKADARIELRIMAKKKKESEAIVGQWSVHPDYIGVTVGGRTVSVETPEDVAYWLNKFPNALVNHGKEEAHSGADQKQN